MSDDTKQRGAGRLTMRIRPNGSKEWIFRYFLDQRKRRVSLGDYPTTSLVDARQEAQRLSGMLTDGHDPAAALQQEKAALADARTTTRGTLGDLMEAYLDDMTERDRRSTEETRTRIYRYIKKPFLSKWNTAANELTSADFRDMLSYHMGRGLTTTTNRIRSWLHAAYQYGLTAENNPRRRHSVSWGLDTNPITSIPRQGDWERQGQTVMSAEVMRAAWWDLPKMRSRSNLAVSAVQLCIATAGQRITALLRLKSDHVNLERGLIDMSADITKSEAPHVVPLTWQAEQVLRPLLDDCQRRGHEYLFPNHRDHSKHMLEDSVSSLVIDYRKRFETTHWTPRDIRRTAKTVLGELGVSKDLRDRLHGHAMHDVSSRHYDRYEYFREKGEAMKVWEKWLTNTLK